VPAVDDDVAGFESWAQCRDHAVDRGRGDHQPDRARSLELCDQVLDVRCAEGTLFDERVDALGVTIIRDHLMAGAEDSERHVLAHATESDHRDSHLRSPSILSSTSSIRCATGRWPRTLCQVSTQPRYERAIAATASTLSMRFARTSCRG